jgi:hypothetical protein
VVRPAYVRTPAAYISQAFLPAIKRRPAWAMTSMPRSAGQRAPVGLERIERDAQAIFRTTQKMLRFTRNDAQRAPPDITALWSILPDAMSCSPFHLLRDLRD